MEKFFRWVWRLNGLLVLLASILVIGFVVGQVINSLTRDTNEPEPINIAADPEGLEKWELGNSQDIRGTDYTLIQLVSENTNVESKEATLNYFGSGEYRRNKAKNVLFVNHVTGEAAWLFADVNQLIASVGVLPDAYRYSSEDPKDLPRAISYTVYHQDTNDDGLINLDDDPSLALSDLDGSNYKVIIEGYEKRFSTRMVNDNTLAITYQANGVGYFLTYSFDSGTVVSNVKLPAVGQ